MSRPPDTTDRLRSDLDHGRGGDKVNHPDPAAAPLGTDDEAAGTTPTAEQITAASRAEVRGRADDPSVDRPRLGAAPGHEAVRRQQGEAPMRGRRLVYLSAAALALLALAVVFVSLGGT